MSRLAAAALLVVVLSGNCCRGAQHVPDAAGRDRREAGGGVAAHSGSRRHGDGSAPHRPSTRRQLQTTQASYVISTVYHGGFAPGWRSASYGCTQDCNFADTVRASIYARTQPWAAVILEASKPFSGRSLLDFLSRGSGITRATFYVENTITRQYSKPCTFGSPGTALASKGPLKVLGSDNDGWIRFQIDLQALASDNTTTKTTAKAATGTWNRLVWRDVSGSGMTLQLDQMKVLAVRQGFNVAGMDWGSSLPPMVPVPDPAAMAPPLASLDGWWGPNVTAVGGTTGGISGGATPPAVSTPTLPSTATSPSSIAPSPAGSILPAPMAMMKLPVLNIDLEEAAVSPGRFIMRLRPNATIGAVRSVCEELANVSLPAGLGAPRFLGSCLPLPGFPAAAPNATSGAAVVAWPYQTFTVASLADLEAMRSVLSSQAVYFERDLVATTSQLQGTALDAAYNVPYWNLDRLDQAALPLDGVYNPGSLNGAGSHVYVVDSGLRWTHADFTDRVGDGTSIIGGSAWDDYGHGTHVAGIAAGAVHGVAKQATVHAVKVLGSDGSGSYSDIIAGLGWVKDHVQRSGYLQAVVVMSLGGPRAASLTDAVEDLAKAGIIVTVAAGNNDGGDACSYSPASAPSAIAVGATSSSDACASFSNLGSCLFTFAPGVSIVSASSAADNAEVTMSGTSMAAPHVAGIVAMVLQAQPGVSVAQVKAALDHAAPRITFDASSPSRLANAQSSRLKPPATTEPAPSTSPAPAPSSSSPGPTTSLTPFPSFDSPSKPEWCATCSWCMFC